MFAVENKIDHGFEDESFRAVYGDHIADPETFDIETRLADEFDRKHNSIECVHAEEIAVSVIALAPEFAALDAAIEASIIAGNDDTVGVPRLSAELEPIRKPPVNTMFTIRIMNGEVVGQEFIHGSGAKRRMAQSRSHSRAKARRDEIERVNSRQQISI